MASPAEDLSQFSISNEEKEKLVAEVIRYVLFKTHQSSGTPIKREELTQIVTRNYRHRALPGFVIDEAKAKLASIFGYEMRELNRARPSSGNQPRSSQLSVTEAKSYVVMSKIRSDVYKEYVENKDSAHLSGFTFVVIGIVYVAGGKITEENLWHQLKRLGLNDNGESHSVLGDPKKALEDLVDQRYLQKCKVNGPEGNSLFYELAERALDGPVSEEIKDYISEIGKKELTYGGED